MRYVSAAAFKSSVSIPDTMTDADVEMALDAASRGVERATRRKKFWKDETPVTRKFTASVTTRVSIDDIAEIDTVEVSGAEVTDYLPEPLNAIEDGRPFTWLSSDNGVFTSGVRGAIEVTGLFGWPEVPAEVPQAVTVLASRLLKRAREAPFAIVTTGGLDGAAERIAMTDPELRMLLAPLTKQLVGWR